MNYILSSLRRVRLSSFIFMFIISNIAHAAYPDPLFALDMRNVAHYPKNFRTTSDPITSNIKYNPTGLADLHIAGSSQFSELALKKMLDHIRAKDLVIIDLREESHGFLNGNAVSWFGKQNAANAGKSAAEINAEQSALLSDLSYKRKARAYTITKVSTEGVVTDARPVDFAVHQISSEAEIASKYHVDYRRFYVQDHRTPSPKTVDKFIKLVNSMPQDQWLLFHCRGGAGRTTSFMAMFDMMKNAKALSFDEIIERQKMIGGKDLTTLPPEDDFKYPLALKRLAFLKKFYEYTHENDDDFATSWSTWLNNHDNES